MLPLSSSVGNGASGFAAGLTSRLGQRNDVFASKHCVVARRHTPGWLGSIVVHLRSQPSSPPTQWNQSIPSAPVASRYHRGRGQDDPHVSVVAQVEGTGPVLPIRGEGGNVCVCLFASGLHRPPWQQQFYLSGPGGRNYLPTSRLTKLPRQFNTFTALISVLSPYGKNLRIAPSPMKCTC